MISQSSLSTAIRDYLERNGRLSWAAKDKRELAWRYLITAIGDVDIGTLKYADAEDYQVYLSKRALSASSVNGYVKCVAVVTNWAIRRELLGENPFERLSKLKEPQREIRVYSDAELLAMLASAPNDMWRARIMAAVTAGLRRSEVLNLTIDDIDFEQQLIRVTPKRQTDYTWPWNPKNYEIRYLPLVCEFHNLLVSSIIPALPTGQPYLMLTDKRYWTLQRRISNLPERIRTRPDENWRPFTKLMQRAEIKNGCFHDLRKTAITRWSRSLPAQEVMKLAGHSDIETTLRYYLAIRPEVVQLANDTWRSIGATGLEPATS